MKHYLLIVVSLVLLLNVNAFALESDLQQAVIISASNQQADIKNNQMIFNGPVKVTQGSITITAQTLRAFSKKNNTQKILIAIGNPARYSQKMENGLMASASAKEIRYDLSTRVLQLTGNAVLEQSGNKVNSNAITYNIQQQKLTAQSGGKGNNRVTTIIKMDQIGNHSSAHSSNRKVSASSTHNTKEKNNKIDSKKQNYPSVTTHSLSTSQASMNKDTSANVSPDASNNQHNWYIQVGAFSKRSSMNKLIKNIQNSGFEYKIHSDNLNGKPILRLLIGPYQTQSAANKDMNKVKFEIENNAYLYQIK
ncbi:lipopolysaccharide transport periplasmic protein LptA [uncultured Shewanella sp.]|uniref:lipopolysaccharide transport periplasmic protein LptA n=1 Tax=uncultured Shewanella sp. TaxID=173975 RepID=UPI00262ABF1C|nr:lipopolysaccharide transport periplasmic protein LptA [uncultured Shewanella sp.]